MPPEAAVAPPATPCAVEAHALPPIADAVDLYLLAEGRHWELARRMGNRPLVVDGIAGVRFAVWAPHARQVSVVGDFNGWDAERYPLRRAPGATVWELFVPGVLAGEHYRYRIVGADGSVFEKADPLACRASMAPATASIIGCAESHVWGDAAWMDARATKQGRDQPISIYEVHVGSWQRRGEEHNRSLTWPELAESLIPYAVAQGFTHLELLPVMTHPFGGSWGYQTLGQFAPQPDYGTPAQFAAFIDASHAAGLGVILDWVPAHFPNDEHGLARFDGTALYELADPREGLHRDWGTLIYDFGRPEVQSFLISSALHWLELFHVDGLRVDAVASMLYRDYSRPEGEWIPNRHGGRENLEAVAFLRTLNAVIAERVPDALVFAEESTAWPGVTQAVDQGGLGFDYKWNMGWMNDSLRYAGRDPLHRGEAHGLLTFGLSYAFNEQFVLPLSHDEVVHGKRSLLAKMPGDRWQQFANLRAYYGFQWAHPGKKLLFMGCEIAQHSEWNHDGSVDWAALEDPMHRGVQKLVRDLNALYVAHPALHVGDGRREGFEWLVADDARNSVFVFLRKAGEGGALIVAICNFTPVVRHDYHVGVPRGGWWQELLNTDSLTYGGSGVCHPAGLLAHEAPSHGQPCALRFTLPPLATIYLHSPPPTP